ncbi:MAG: hypothetical protein DLM57_11270 [Pseudonocardiales bacterium]|nr:MAG: hypothetical protein DLM57_11270 [Pseudonocardiales bacterium]
MRRFEVVSRQPKRDAIARERKRRRQQKEPPPAPAPAATTRRSAASACGWCGGVIEVKATGRIPKWCSPACRQRAWEQSRAAASGRAAVEVVERVVAVPFARERIPLREEWPGLLRELAAQLEDGRIYARDLPNLGSALNDLAAAYNRRQNLRRVRR